MRRKGFTIGKIIAKLKRSRSKVISGQENRALQAINTIDGEKNKEDSGYQR